MVARLKLKEIDGRAPPGIKPHPLFLKAARKGSVVCLARAKPLVAPAATPSNCGELLKLSLPAGAERPGLGHNVRDVQWMIRNQSPTAALWGGSRD
jgi:hypothetical protein